MARRARNGPSRRKIIGIAALVPAALKAHASADAETLPTLCSKWLAQDAKVEHLSLRWGQLEVRAIREFGWCQLSPEARRGLPLQAEMDQICAQLFGSGRCSGRGSGGPQSDQGDGPSRRSRQVGGGRTTFPRRRRGPPPVCRRGHRRSRQPGNCRPSPGRSFNAPRCVRPSRPEQSALRYRR